MTRHPYLDVDGPIAFAHRGGAGEFPENTLRAFRHAVSLGFSHVETDVHATADGVAVAFHDDSLDRATDRRGRIAELPWSEVRRALVSGTDEIMRLDELLEELPDTRFNLDPKSDNAVGPLAEVLTRLGAVERVCVCSFSDRRTRRVRQRLGPSLCVGAGPRGIARLMAAAAGTQARASVGLSAPRATTPATDAANPQEERAAPPTGDPPTGDPPTARRTTTWAGPQEERADTPDVDPGRLRQAEAPSGRPGRLGFHAAQVPVRARGLTIVRPSVVDAAHRHGAAVHVWTVDDPAEMHRLLDLGVDGIMTDQPAELRRVMIDRGHWKS